MKNKYFEYILEFFRILLLHLRKIVIFHQDLLFL